VDQPALLIGRMLWDLFHKRLIIELVDLFKLNRGVGNFKVQQQDNLQSTTVTEFDCCAFCKINKRVDRLTGRQVVVMRWSDASDTLCRWFSWLWVKRRSASAQCRNIGAMRIEQQQGYSSDPHPVGHRHRQRQG